MALGTIDGEVVDRITNCTPRVYNKDYIVERTPSVYSYSSVLSQSRSTNVWLIGTDYRLSDPSCYYNTLSEVPY